MKDTENTAHQQAAEVKPPAAPVVAEQVKDVAPPVETVSKVEHDNVVTRYEQELEQVRSKVAEAHDKAEKDAKEAAEKLAKLEGELATALRAEDASTPDQEDPKDVPANLLRLAGEVREDLEDDNPVDTLWRAAADALEDAAVKWQLAEKADQEND